VKLRTTAVLALLLASSACRKEASATPNELERLSTQYTCQQHVSSLDRGAIVIRARNGSRGYVHVRINKMTDEDVKHVVRWCAT
jgi:hypothetical protein